MTTEHEMDPGRIQQELEARRDTLMNQVEKMRSDIRREQGPLEADFAEQAVQRENDDVLDALDTASQKELVEIEAALRRLKEGVYGQCSKCGEVIEAKRLKALPRTTLCLACAE